MTNVLKVSMFIDVCSVASKCLCLQDEVTAAYSVCFSLDASKLYAGYKQTIRIFDTEYPNKFCKPVKTFGKYLSLPESGVHLNCLVY